MRNEKNFIDGHFVDAGSDAGIHVTDPATGQHAGSVDAASDTQVRQAVQAAAQAQRMWARLPAIERGNQLRRFADAIERHAHIVGHTLAMESGKSVADATGEAIYGAEIVRYHAEWARRIEGEVIPSDNTDETILLQREPLGVVACLIPFNYPVYTLLRKIAPALIAGNTVVVRPSNHTPLSAYDIARAAQDAGMPAGTINIVAMEHEQAEVLCTQPDVAMITLTGSVRAGRAVLDYCKANIAKPSLELGGKTPAIIEADADLERAADAIVVSKTTHCGQLCTAIERVYVHESVHGDFLALLKAKFAAIRIGNRAEDARYMGPLVSAPARDGIHAKVLRAVAEGAVVETGGTLPEGPGYFYPPTLLSGCRQDMEIVQEEIFGPVLPVLRYASLDDALRMANDHQFGLSSVLYTENYRAALRVANHIEAGELYVNRTPADPYQGFHAGWKRSGLGGDDGKHGMLEFTQTRLVVMKH
ncbi:aldehyde dehydrogenase [Dyella terrae]|uniref:aldehyde dehydrogenase n=1 Tax=Dyella terrae TaxID=522259 RepID=UPI001EFD457E|nr:aldehyde dehydrogenase [Dyella terrae]ULU24539.1 aldehyde dehydrogenase [Dyella terrae]